jgi:chromosomal replication initiation ATPase DnaA
MAAAGGEQHDNGQKQPPILLIKKVADYHKLDPADLSTNSKASTMSRARAVLCYLCVREFGDSCAQVAKRINVSPSTVSKAVARGLDKVEDEKLERITK